MALSSHLDEGMVPDPDCPVCNGLGEIWKYYKEVEIKLIHQPYAFCPQCFPDDYVSMGDGGKYLVEITYEEANDLNVNHGYRWD